MKRQWVPGCSRYRIRAVITATSGPRTMTKDRWSGSLTVLTLKDIEKDSVNLAVWSSNDQGRNVYIWKYQGIYYIIGIY